MANKSSWTLPLQGFTPTNINYTVAAPDSCLVCRNYDEIDAFAKAVTLQKLQPLFESAARIKGDINTSGSYVQGVFDATVLLNSIKQLTMPSTNEMMAILKKQKWYTDDPSASLRMIFSLYANFPIKNDVDLQKRSVIFTKARNKNQELQKEAVARGDTAENGRLRAEYDAITTQWKEEQAGYSWVGLIVREGLVDRVAQALWHGFLTAKVKSAGFVVADNVQKDYVARARLFSMWVSLSVSYDYKLAYDKSMLSKLKSERPVADILFTATEVCKGYADLFVQMFNACEGTEQAVGISGYSRSDGGLQSYEYGSFPTGHRWAAFPSPNFVTDNKVIDPTWTAFDVTRPHNDDPWFSISNTAMAMSHVPFNANGLYYSAKDPPVTSEALWAQSQPFRHSEGTAGQFWIDLSTVTPMTNWVASADKDNKVLTVTFKNNCRHQGPNTRGYSLGFFESKLKIEDFKAKRFDVTQEVAFTATSKPNTGTDPWQWSATVKLPAAKQGWLAILQTPGDQPKQRNRVTIWQV